MSRPVLDGAEVLVRSRVRDRGKDIRENISGGFLSGQASHHLAALSRYRHAMVHVYRPIAGRVEINGLRKPREGEPTNRQWLKDTLGARIRPEWVAGPRGWDGHWAVARTHFREVVDALAVRAGHVEVDVDFNVHEQCDTRCQRATGDDCTCQCFGANHGIETGAGAYGPWVEVGDTTLVSHGIQRLSFVRTNADVVTGRR